METFPDRPIYHPSGRCRWAVFVPFIALAFSVSVGMGWVLAWMWRAGYTALGSGWPQCSPSAARRV